MFQSWFLTSAPLGNTTSDRLRETADHNLLFLTLEPVTSITGTELDRLTFDSSDRFQFLHVHVREFHKVLFLDQLCWSCSCFLMYESREERNHRRKGVNVSMVSAEHRPCSRFGPDTVPPRCSCLFRGQALGFPSSGGAISTGTDAQIYKDELEMNRSQAETQHANPISWPRSRASPLGISTVYRHMLRRPDGALLCRTDILRMHVCIRAVNPPTVNDRWLLDLKSSLLIFRVTWPRSGSLALRPVDDGSICSCTEVTPGLCDAPCLLKVNGPCWPRGSSDWPWPGSCLTSEMTPSCSHLQQMCLVWLEQVGV